jgi:hypothetical protein
MERIEERKVFLAEEESKCRMLVLSAQAKKEEVLIEKESVLVQQEQTLLKRKEMEYKVDMALNRKRLIDAGVDIDEIETLFPL